MGFSRESLDALYQSVKQSMSPYRFSHTEGVRRAAVEIGKLYEIPYLDELCAALKIKIKLARGSLWRGTGEGILFHTSILRESDILPSVL